MQENKVKISDLMSKRIDPYYYNEEFQNLIKKLKQIKNICNVGTLIKSWNRGDGPREGFYTEDYRSGVPFIRINNLKQNSIDVSGIKYIYRNIHETKLKRTKVTTNNLIFAISGTKENLGTVAIIPDTIKEANLNSALVRLNLDNSKISDKYFCVLFSLNFVRTQINYIGKGAAQNNLNNEEISQILIPVPSFGIQEKIVKIMSDANKKRQEKYDIAKDLLESINDILLKNLNIVIPKIDNKKEFKTTISNILGSRLDPKYHQPKYEDLVNILESYPNCVNLFTAFDSKSLIKGYLPKEKEKNGHVSYLQIRNINLDGTIDLKNLATAKENFFKQNQKLNKNDIIVVATGATIGKIGLWIYEENCYLGGDMYKFHTNTNFYPYYVLAYLLSPLGQLQIKRSITGATNGHISSDDIENIKIIQPQLTIQKNISEEFKNRLKKAKQLKKEADEEFEKTKARVERIILGEETL